MRAVKLDSQKIGEFIAWLDDKGLAIAKNCECGSLGCADHHGMVRVSKSIEQILADYFEIDLNKVERERRALLDVCGPTLSCDSIAERKERAMKECICTVGDPCDYHAATCVTCIGGCKGHPVATSRCEMDSNDTDRGIYQIPEKCFICRAISYFAVGVFTLLLPIAKVVNKWRNYAEKPCR